METNPNFAKGKYERPLAPLHSILQRSLVHQSVFFYVRGVQAVNPEIGVQTAVQSFIDKFCPDADHESLTVSYYRLLHDYMKDNKLQK